MKVLQKKLPIFFFLCLFGIEMGFAQFSPAKTHLKGETLTDTVSDELDYTLTEEKDSVSDFSVQTLEETLNRGIIVDQIVAVVGTKMVKLSDVEKAVENLRMTGELISEQSRCGALEAMLVSDLYALQADEDSINISENEVENELESRIRYFVEQIGSREKLEEFYGKTILQLKEEYREMIKSALIARTMENKLTQDIKVTPTEVKRFYDALPKDSVPLVPIEYELSSIVKKAIISSTEKELAKSRLEELRSRIAKGENFRSLAALYSEDPGSARKGGELGYGGRGEWASEFESMAFSLPINELSPVFETQFGFHILEVLDKKGEMVNVRHILIRAKPSDMDLLRAKIELDSVSKLIRKAEYSFEDAVRIFSDDAGGQGNGAYLSPMTRKPSYTSEEIEHMIYLSVEKLEEGEITHALPFVDEDGQNAFRIFFVKRKTPPHRANLREDYDKIYVLALEKAKTTKMQNWMKDKIANTYIRLLGSYADCDFKYKWKM
ncbi:MAG: peptidylprolyl isomerase [Bacteroidales bacterium]